MEYMRYKINIPSRGIIAGQIKRCKFCFKLGEEGKMTKAGNCHSCQERFNRYGVHHKKCIRLTCSACEKSTTISGSRISAYIQRGTAYCSERCAYSARRARIMSWRAKNPDKRRQHSTTSKTNQRQARQFFQALAMTAAVMSDKPNINPPTSA